jgi:anti-anti-sigma factor
VEGELDLSTCEELEGAIREAEESNPATLVLDLSGVTFLDSMGLGTLVKAHERARLQGRRLLLVAPPEPAARVFRINVLDERFQFVDSLAAITEAEPPTD